MVKMHVWMWTYARNVRRMVDVGMRMGDVEDILDKHTKKRMGAMSCPDAHSNDSRAANSAYVFPFAAVLLNSFAFSIAA
jgi:hypothetical protein